MGQRANLIVVSEPTEYELYYTHWGAGSLDCSLFWGPEQALAYIRRQHSRAEGADWLDEVWAEGGAVLDVWRRKLLWFGGEDVRFEIPLRRVHLGIMRELWPGWDVEWAYEGVGALARHVGEPVKPLMRKFNRSRPVLEEPAEPHWISYVISLREGGRFKVHAQDGNPFELSLAGPKLLDALRAAELPDRYDYAARNPYFPSGGIHVDADARRVELWCSDPAADLPRRFRAAWPEWDAVWHRDRFEAHQAALGDRLVLPSDDRGEPVSRIRSTVLRAPRDHSGMALEMADHLGPREELQINPLALRDDPCPEPGADAADVFDAAVARWRARVDER